MCWGEGVEGERGIERGGGRGEAGYLLSVRSASSCQSAFRLRGVGPKPPGSLNKLRGRRYARTHTHVGYTPRERLKREYEAYTPADGGAEPKKRLHSVKQGRGIAFATSLSCFRSSVEEESRGQAYLLLWIYSFIYLLILL